MKDVIESEPRRLTASLQQQFDTRRPLEAPQLDALTLWRQQKVPATRFPSSDASKSRIEVWCKAISFVTVSGLPTCNRSGRNILIGFAIQPNLNFAKLVRNRSDTFNADHVLHQWKEMLIGLTDHTAS
jgi:hypothetical protein